MRRSWVLVEVGGGHARATLHYVGHRIPRAVAVPLAVAARLAKQGTHVVVRRAA